ncbi:MAG: prenyltransferase/squalene oxidase repeat-containing protein, partial [Planctomycetota bacterium]
CGQLPAQKRTLKETTATTTAWTAIALMRNNGSFDEQAATTLIDAIDNPESTEFLAAKSLLLQQQRADKTKLQFAARQLLNAQNSDGGWGWRLDANSDALGTGIAMYALATNRDHPDVADENETTKSIQRGTEFLLSTQRENGSWSVPGTKRNVKDKPTPTAGDWGTAWAVLALATSQPDD